MVASPARTRRQLHWLVGLFSWLPLAACHDADWFAAPVPANLKVEPSPLAQAPVKEPSGPVDWARTPVPTADGPKIAPLAMVVGVREGPERDARVVGTLRVGTRVARSRAPVSHRDCEGGWYAIRPVGFLCNGPDATVRLDNPIARAIHIEPDRSRPMPYRYGFLRAIAPNYLRVPTKDEQFKYEMRLKRHLRNWKKFSDVWDALDVGANDVPVDARGLAVGDIPDHARPLGISERYGGDGDDKIPWWLTGDERRIPNLSSFRAPSYAVIANRIKRHAGVALIGTFIAGNDAQDRRFAITTDARLIPADKIKASSGSPFHGAEISKIGLPVAFPIDPSSHFYQMESGRLVQKDRAPYRSLVPLTGTVHRFGEIRLVETRDHLWLKSDELQTVAKPSSLPAFARDQIRWIDISIINQTLVLWQGATPIFATLVSTGRDGLGEPGKTLSTPLGTFRIYQKYVTTTMDSDVADKEFELRDVPWVMYFKGGYALHAAYWHDGFGHPRSHGCVNLSPLDARFVFNWSSPVVPEHWQSVDAGSPFEEGTIVNIHP